ncbi:MAG: hypothetical protein ACQCN4_00675 [Candidatus Bathyarchaeia archaeon]|jgi:hypothetical protein
MSTGNRFADWCRIPPPAPKNNHKKLLASGLICAVLSISIFAGLPLYGTLFVGSAGTLAVSGTALSIANLGQGPLYLQNATYQQIAEANNSTVQNYNLTMHMISENLSNGLYFAGSSSINCTETSAVVDSTIVNLGDKDLTATSIDFYRGNSLFAQINGPFRIKAHSVGIVTLHICNLTGLTNEEAQLITQFRHQGETDATIFAGRVMYAVTLRTSEDVAANYDMFLFPTAYVWPDCA